MNPDKIGKLHQHNWRAPRLGRTPTGAIECRECDLEIAPEDQKFWDKLYELFAKCEEWRVATGEEEMLRLRDSLTDRLQNILPLTQFCQLKNYQAFQELAPAYYRIDDYALWLTVQKNGVHDGWASLLVGIDLRALFGANKWEFVHVFGHDRGKERFEVRSEPAIHMMKFNLPFDHVASRREQDRGAGFRYANEHC